MTTKLSDIKHDKHEVDARGQVLGKVATKVATLLVGKQKPYFVRHLDCGDYVTVLNAKDVVLTGKKWTKKKYTRYSGYPGGLKTATAQEVMAKKPTEVVRHAILGMLPKNKLEKFWAARLEVKA